MRSFPTFSVSHSSSPIAFAPPAVAMRHLVCVHCAASFSLIRKPRHKKHFPKHIQTVIACRSVCSDRKIDSSLHKPCNGCNSTCSFILDAGFVTTESLCFSKYPYLLLSNIPRDILHLHIRTSQGCLNMRRRHAGAPLHSSTSLMVSELLVEPSLIILCQQAHLLSVVFPKLYTRMIQGERP